MCFCKNCNKSVHSVWLVRPWFLSLPSPSVCVSYPPALTTIHLLSFAFHSVLTLPSVPNTSRSQFVLFVPSLLHPVASLTATTASAEYRGFTSSFRCDIVSTFFCRVFRPRLWQAPMPILLVYSLLRLPGRYIHSLLLQVSLHGKWFGRSFNITIPIKPTKVYG